MTLRTILLALFCAALTVALVDPLPAEAQIWKKVKNKAKQTVERKAEEKTEDAVEGAIDGVEDAMKCAVTDETCIETAREEGRTVVMTDENGEVIRDDDGAPVADPAVAQAQVTEAPGDLAPGEGAWANYDFVPGDRVLFAEDFTDGFVGDFPKRLTFVKGNAETVEWQGQRLMRINEDGMFDLQLTEPLSDRFTLEFQVHAPAAATTMRIYPVTHNAPADRHGTTAEMTGDRVIHIGSRRRTGIATGTRFQADVAGAEALAIMDRLVPIRVMVDGSYAKVFVGEQRVANVPNANLGRSETLRFWFHEIRDPLYLGDLRVAAGGRQMMYDQIMAEGKVVTRGILFDTGSARLQPESTPTLTDIGRMLEQHADLRLSIEGHTDNTGTADGNIRLSQERAEAVRAFLTSEYDVDPDRLVAAGKGQTVPAAPNDTEEGRQTNRRVELVRM